MLLLSTLLLAVPRAPVPPSVAVQDEQAHQEQEGEPQGPVSAVPS